MAEAEVTIPVFATKNEIRAYSRARKYEGKKVALVPTMGYLHEGHLSLLKTAREQADIVIASIYVNPTQFSKNEDFDVYPRDTVGDRLKLQRAGCDAIFEPFSLYHQVEGIDDTAQVVGREVPHPDAHETFVQVEQLQQCLCGRSRPHFFRGVATVVTKLFHIVEPDVALFGKKDYQQWRILRRLVRDLDFDIEIIGVAIGREEDGLALSSRNVRLTPAARQAALSISQGLLWAQQEVAAKRVTDPEAIRGYIRNCITESGGVVDYVEVVDAEHLSPISDASQQLTLVAVAAHFPARDKGTVRLIDNIELHPPT